MRTEHIKMKGGFNCHICSKEVNYAEQIEVGHAFLVACLKCLDRTIEELEESRKALKVFIEQERAKERKPIKPPPAKAR